MKRKTAFVSLLMFSLILLCFFSCDFFFFRRNPNLRLFLNPEGSAFNPVVSPDGNKVYYLYGSGPIRGGGDLRVINSDGSNDRLILEGNFFSLAISPDGEKLALTTGDLHTGGILLVMDTSGSKIETIPVGDSIMDVEFGSSSEEIFFFRNRKGVYKWSYRDSTEKLILKEEAEFRFMDGFDVSGDSLLFINGKLYSLIPDTLFRGYFEDFFWPQFSPKNSYILVGTGKGGWNYYKELYLLRTDSFSRQNLNIGKLYRKSGGTSVVTQPYWWPDGNKIIFAGSFKRAGSLPYDFDLWILEIK